MNEQEETLDVGAAVERLNAALALQYRSTLQYSLTSGSLFGFEFQALGDRLWSYGQAELADARLLVEKVVALEGSPTTDVAELKWTGDPGDAVGWLIETEEEAIAIANGTEFGLVAGVFTQDISRAMRCTRRLKSGQVFVNEWYAGGIETPFGGVGLSGFGREKGQEALYSYVRTKNIAIRVAGE